MTARQPGGSLTNPLLASGEDGVLGSPRCHDLAGGDLADNLEGDGDRESPSS